MGLTRGCRRARVLVTVALFLLALLLARRLSGWALRGGSSTGSATGLLPPTLRPLRGAAQPNVSSLPHLAGWRRPEAGTTRSWRVERALAGDVAPCHAATRDYLEHPVRLRDTAGYSMTRLGHEGGGGAIDCAVPCVRVTGTAFRPMALGVAMCVAAFTAAGLCVWMRIEARAALATKHKSKADPPMRLPRRLSQRRNETTHGAGASTTVWLPPLLLLVLTGCYTSTQLLEAWSNCADASPSASFSLGEGCGWSWSSTMENRGDTIGQMLGLRSPTIVSSTMLASDVPVPYAEQNLLEQIYGGSIAADIKRSFSSRSGGDGDGQGLGLAAAFISNCGPGAPQLERLRW
jgi:hypothetical protein